MQYTSVCSQFWDEQTKDQKGHSSLRGSLDPADYRQPIMTLLFVKRLYDTFEEMLRSCDKKVGVRRKLMRIKIGITFSFLKNKDGPSFLKHQKILAKRLIKYVENY